MLWVVCDFRNSDFPPAITISQGITSEEGSPRGTVILPSSPGDLCYVDKGCHCLKGADSLTGVNQHSLSGGTVLVCPG